MGGIRKQLSRRIWSRQEIQSNLQPGKFGRSVLTAVLKQSLHAIQVSLFVKPPLFPLRCCPAGNTKKDRRLMRHKCTRK
jgi:hypothetical protein